MSSNFYPGPGWAREEYVEGLFLGDRVHPCWNCNVPYRQGWISCLDDGSAVWGEQNDIVCAKCGYVRYRWKTKRDFERRQKTYEKLKGKH